MREVDCSMQKVYVQGTAKRTLWEGGTLYGKILCVRPSVCRNNES